MIARRVALGGGLPPEKALRVNIAGAFLDPVDCTDVGWSTHGLPSVGIHWTAIRSPAQDRCFYRLSRGCWRGVLADQ